MVQRENGTSSKVNGYTEGENELVEGKKYVLELKEFFNRPTKVMEHTGMEKVHLLKSSSLDIVFWLCCSFS